MSSERLDFGRGNGPSLWQRIKDVALADVTTLVRGVDEEALAEIERLLLAADFGVEATAELVDGLERAAKRGEVETGPELRELLAVRVREMLEDARPADGPAAGELRTPEEGPGVVLLLGVNGTGKTTTAGKLAARCRRTGEGVLLATTDTFRTGAREQLRIWADRVGAEFVGGEEGGDPAAVAYDAVDAASKRGIRRVILDTAGRLHTQRDLLGELEKIDRVVGRLADGAPHERLLVVDATSGQNVVTQARRFGESLPLTGMVLTKLDGTASGGSAVAAARELGLPVRYVGTGEAAEDLEQFDPGRYVAGLLDGG